MKLLVIPDIHLKIKVIQKAYILMKSGEFDNAIFIGDLVDDWHQEQNESLYRKTFEASKNFLKEFPDTLVCYGNHDLSYIWSRTETGFSWYMSPLCIQQLKELKKMIPAKNRAFVHRIDNAIFSHGGVMEDFVKMYCKKSKDIDSIINTINYLPVDILWSDESPIWARPQYGRPTAKITKDYLQVVGHTPMHDITCIDSLLSVDVFSTYSNGNPIGTEKFVWVDTITKEFGIAG